MPGKPQTVGQHSSTKPADGPGRQAVAFIFSTSNQSRPMELLQSLGSNPELSCSAVYPNQYISKFWHEFSGVFAMELNRLRSLYSKPQTMGPETLGPRRTAVTGGC